LPKHLKYCLSGTRDGSEFISFTPRPLAALFFASHTPILSDIVLVDLRMCMASMTIENSANVFDTSLMKLRGGWPLDFRSRSNVETTQEVALQGFVPPGAIQGYVKASNTNGLIQAFCSSRGDCKTMTRFQLEIMKSFSKFPPTPKKLDRDVAAVFDKCWHGAVALQRFELRRAFQGWSLRSRAQRVAQSTLRVCYSKALRGANDSWLMALLDAWSSMARVRSSRYRSFRQQFSARLLQNAFTCKMRHAWMAKRTKFEE
jgi:hypothetical protein